MDTTAQKQLFEVEIHLPVRTYDIDFAGVVNNIVYVRWLEDLRLEMLARHFPLDEQLKNGIAPVIVQTKIDYKQPIKISDVPTGKMWIEIMESLRWTVNAVISVNGKVAALGEQVGIFVDLQNNKPIRMPERLKQKYQEFVA
ncbi:thioesterase family protein [Leptolyngbya sp. FACHB-711]|uniref:acyl-CoA thioesterase n=1 Tax=unclassified Leptolyngbya TaxID=2650499 RepID=UPI001686B861|nr:thioesterase family protein [Leptolyngbya sp. FACHB-711]MBD1853672.1 acyl-CoA thioesterase [Cyanobacteria bacterium FACHB-502]MBD2024661.1 acyl-CoA thioesterase [Leptolyngbya sp. FACHB-711]